MAPTQIARNTNPAMRKLMVDIDSGLMIKTIPQHRVAIANDIVENSVNLFMVIDLKLLICRKYIGPLIIKVLRINCQPLQKKCPCLFQ